MPLHRPLLALTLALAVLLSVVSTTAQQPLKPLKKKPEVPYVPSHEKVVAAMPKAITARAATSRTVRST